MPGVSVAALLGAVVTLWAAAASPVHGAETIHGSLDIACGVCHGDAGETVPYPGSAFDHRSASFQLDGRHRAVSCRECHEDLVFRGMDGNCSACHDDIHNGEFGGDCARCHTTQSFTLPYDVTGFHDASRFPLRGAHLTVPCIDCHTDSADGIWRGLSTDCVSCHRDDYTMTADPDHRAAGIPYDCAMCHDEQPGFSLVYDHSLTGFELTGAHVILECTECHDGSFFRALPDGCVACHRDEYTQATDPDHRALQFPQACEDCHTTSAWSPSTFCHDATLFPLTGVHLTVDCAECHADGEYFGTPRECAVCHRDDYDRTTEPIHSSAGYSLNCEDCHTTTAWIPATIGRLHESYPLTGAHLTVACESCHTNGDYYGTPHECAACHDDEYSLATDPDHQALQLSQVCEDCHTTTAWSPSTFSHDTTLFPLTGAHVSLDCVRCHTASSGAHPPADCLACHEDAYNDAADHVSQSYPADCGECHSTSTWTPASFTHDEFPIYSGNHRNQWNTCADCHPAAGNFQVFTCFTCHSPNTHGRSYTSDQCYQCHPDGRD